jgi:hypothetical protein
VPREPEQLTVLPRGRRAWIRLGLLVGVPSLVVLLGGAWMISMPGESHAGPLPPLTDAETDLSTRLRAHVEKLAREIGERNVWTPDELEAAAAYVEAQWRALGHEPESQEYELRGVTVRNVEIEVAGTSAPDEIVLVGAHYDSVMGCPGANDNGTGVAALLEATRLLHGKEHARTLRFVAFVNEEPPFFQTSQMGSRQYARRSRKRGEDIVAMLSLETIGYYRDDEGSQHYPPPLGLVYPSKGNFVAFVGNVRSRPLVRRCVKSFRGHTRFPSEGGALPGFLPGIGWSDHWSFWQEGYQAVMVTDTAPFRYAHYHGPGDTPEKVDYDRTARVTAGVARVIAELAGAAGGD